MADDIAVTGGAYSATVAAQDVAGVHVQEVLLVDLTRAIVTALSNSAAGTAGIPILAQRVDTLGPIADTAGKMGFLQTDANGCLVVTLGHGSRLSSAQDSVTVVVPADPFGVNADGASATGSLSAKLRFIASTGIPITAIAAGTTLIGDVDLQPRATGGLTMAPVLISAASTNATSVKASAGKVYAIQAFNTNAVPRYLKLYNKASAPTVGTDTPLKTLTIPGNTAAAGFILSIWQGMAFATGIAFALTTGVADADTGAVAANEIVVNLDYK